MSALLRRVTRSTVATNAIWNYAGVFWLAALNMVTLPVYLRLLGRTEWGLVAVCVTLQNALALLDLGIGQIMVRDVAASPEPVRQARALSAYIRIYSALALAGFVIVQCLAGTLARHWFQAPEIATSRLELALRLVLVQFVFQFSNNAHVGYWNGLQLQRKANTRQVVFTTLRHAAALLCVTFVHRSAFSYLVPFVAITCIEWASNRREVLRQAGCGFWRGAELSLAEVLGVARTARGMAAGIVLGLIVSQLDRIVLTKTQNISDFGVYAIVASAGLAFLNLQYPLMRAYFPRIVQERQATTVRSSRASRQLLAAVVVFCVLPCLSVAVLAPWLLRLWLRDPAVVSAGTLPFRLIIIAVALNALYNVVYQSILADGRTRVIIFINAACVATCLTTAAVVGSGAGIALGGAMWVAASSTQLFLGAIWTWRSPRST